jgi:hypothetical protein
MSQSESDYSDEIQHIHALLKSQELSHPLSSQKPTTIEVFSALRDLCGPPAETTTAATEAVEDFIGEHTHYVIVLVDGLGDTFSRFFPEGGFFTQSERLPLITGFPSATAPLLTSFATASWPCEHGISGWNTYFREISRTISVLPGTERGTGTLCSELRLSYSDLIPSESWYSSRKSSMLSILPAKIGQQDFSVWARGNTPYKPYTKLSQAGKSIQQHIRKCKTGRSFTYCYIPSLDHIVHRYGCSSQETEQQIILIDSWLQKLAKNLPQSACLLVTADHGLIDIKPENRHIISDKDPIMRFLIAPPSGETSVPVFHVIPGHEANFRKYFASTKAGQDFTLLTPREAEQLHLFGPDLLGPIMRSRLGSFVGIAAKPATIEYQEEAIDPPFAAIHGGMRPEEMFVSLYRYKG